MAISPARPQRKHCHAARLNETAARQLKVVETITYYYYCCYYF